MFNFAHYAAFEYAWESATPPGTALMLLDTDKMVAVVSSRNPTLAGALTRLQREIRNHDNAKKKWTGDELKKLYETHESLLDLVSLFCYVPRTKHLPSGLIR
ncbi:hypothetical protein RJT34_12450 [Clitoria ternatea]|uniref:Uncharacterized protein n=1 Tax=Clitoria ternatea TaxID=43366 RepID=A0AAN9JM67_CLITE